MSKMMRSNTFTMFSRIQKLQKTQQKRPVSIESMLTGRFFIKKYLRVRITSNCMRIAVRVMSNKLAQTDKNSLRKVLLIPSS